MRVCVSVCLCVCVCACAIEIMLNIYTLLIYSFQLASKGQVEELERLFRTDPERLKFKDAKGHTPLHHASAAGHVAIIDFLISTAKGRIVQARFLSLTNSHKHTRKHGVISNEVYEIRALTLKRTSCWI